MIKKLLVFLSVIGILILAAFLRLYMIQDYMTFLGDEGRDVLVVYNILHGHLTLLGPTSSVGGFFLGPIYYYFMAPFLWLFQYNPVGPAVMVAIFGTITVWLVYKIGKDLFGTIAGIVAALLYAISPVVIAYSRSSWNPNLMPFFTIVTLWIVYKGVRASMEVGQIKLTKKSLSLFVVSGFLCGILMQLHYLATFVVAIMIVYLALVYLVFNRSWLVLFKKNESRVTNQESSKNIFLLLNSYFLILLGFLIGWSPYLAFEARHGFPNTISIFKFVFHSQEVHGGGNMWQIISDVFFRLFGRLVTDFPPPEQVSLRAHPTIGVWYGLTLTLGLVSVAIFGWQLYKQFKNQSSEFRIEKILQYSLVATWFIIGIFLFGFYKKTIYDYYFGFLFPLPFLLVGNTIAFALSKQALFKLVGVAALITLCIVNIQAMPFRYPPNRQLAQIKQISEFVLTQTNNKPYNFALLTGGNSDHAYRYFFTLAGKPPVAILNPAIDPKRTSVTDQLLIVCETSPCAPLGNSLWEVAGFGRAEIANQWPVSVVQVYKLKHYQENKQINQ